MVEAYLPRDSEEEGRAEQIVERVAQGLKYRRSVVRRAGPKQLVRLLNKAIARRSEKLATDVLVRFHVRSRPELLSSVYDALGVAHDGAELDDEAAETPLAEDAVDRAVALAADDPSGRAAICLEVMALSCVPAWRPGVRQIVERVRRLGEGRDESGAGAQAAGRESYTSLAPPPPELDAAKGERDTDAAAEEAAGVESPHFTTLDRLLIRTVVSALNDVHGALDEDELDDLVQEVLELNDTRAQSFFHRGFVDSLLDRPLQPMGHGENNERRAWYLAGYILGVMRREGGRAVVKLLEELPPSDDEILLGASERPVEAGAFLLPSIMSPLLDQGEYDLALRWLERHMDRSDPEVMKRLIRWARMAFLETDPAIVARILEACRSRIDRDPRTRLDSKPDLGHRLERRLAIAYRLQGKPSQAEAIIDRLLLENNNATTRSKLLGDKLLLKMGMRSLEDLRVGKEDTRESLGSSLDEVAPLIDEEKRASVDPSAVTDMAVAVGAVLSGTDDRKVVAPALDSIRRAIAAIEDWNREFWTKNGVLPRARFYLSLLELRMIDEPALAAPAAARLVSLLEEGLEEPLDLILDAVKYAVFQDVANADRLARIVLSRWPQATLSRLDLQSLVRRSRPFREKLVEALEANEDLLNGEERWAAWRKLLEGALSADERDIETARRALDELETLAVSFGFARELSELLETRENWDPAWEPMDAEMARFHVLESAGEVVEARAVLVNVAHQAITDEAEDSADLVDMLEELGAGRDALENLRLRINAMQREEPSEKEREQEPPKPVSIVFFGGDERQAAYEQRLLEEFSQSHPGCSVEFEFNCWSSNWARRMDGFENKIEKSNAIIVMRLMRTELGRKLRKAANESGKRWIPCTGRGLDSMRRSIENAISVARRQGASRARHH